MWCPAPVSCKGLQSQCRTSLDRTQRQRLSLKAVKQLNRNVTAASLWTVETCVESGDPSPYCHTEIISLEECYDAAFKVLAPSGLRRIQAASYCEFIPMTLEPDSHSILPDQQGTDGVTPQTKATQESKQATPESPVGSYVQTALEHKRNTHHCRPDQTPIGKYILEVLAAGILGAYTVAAIQQLRVMSGQLTQMTQQSNTIQRQLEATDRPWITDTVRSASEFTASNGAFSWAVTIRAENVGHSVATAIFPQAKLIAIQGADFIDAPRRKARELCDEVSARFEKVKKDPVVWSNAIFPGDSSEFTSNPILWPSEINSATTFDGGVKVGRSVIPMLIGCVEYHYATSEKPHKTWFVYTLAHSDDPTIPLPTRVFFSLGKTVPSANMVLIKADQLAD